MAIASTALAAFDHRAFFDKALHYGVEQGIVSPARLQIIQEDFAKGIVQIANFFGTAHLRPELELARLRMVNLIGLYLEESSGGDLQLAAISLRDKTFLSHSKGGSDMLKRLHAMPDGTTMLGGTVSAEDQRAYLDEKTASASISLANYRSELAIRQEHQSMIDFSFWLVRKLGASREDIANEDTDSLIRSAMLVLFVQMNEKNGLHELKLPTRTAFVRLIKAAKQAKAKPDEDRLKAFLKDAPTEFQRLTRRAMQRFIAHDLPQIRDPGNTADKLAHGASLQFFLSESADDDVREYVRLVAREWDRVTRGEADDPAVLATVFLFIATGLEPKASMLLREAKDVVRIFRASGFNSQAVIDFVGNHAPEAIREDLLKIWTNDLKGEAEEQLADSDPNWPDSYMERALEYLRRTCRAAWKGRGR